jgi:homoserine O-acetyltransferase/O-succinyltransferase
MISKMLFRAVSAAVLALLGAAALAAEYPTPKQGDWVAHDFRFHTGEMMSEVRLHYTTIGDPSGIPVVVLHGSGQHAYRLICR